MPRIDRDARRRLTMARYVERGLSKCAHHPALLELQLSLVKASTEVDRAVTALRQGAAELKAAKVELTRSRRRVRECSIGVAHLVAQARALEGPTAAPSTARPGSLVAIAEVSDALRRLPALAEVARLFEAVRTSVDLQQQTCQRLTTELETLRHAELVARNALEMKTREARAHIRFEEKQGSPAQRHMARFWDRHRKKKPKPQP